MSAKARKRSVIVAGHPTSVSLEPEFWAALKELAAARGLSTAALIAEIDRGRKGNLSSAIRVQGHGSGPVTSVLPRPSLSSRTLPPAVPATYSHLRAECEMDVRGP